MYLYLASESKLVTKEQLLEWEPAFKKYTNHVRGYWPRPCDFKVVDPKDLPKNGWQVVIFDYSDEPGALGYHDYTPGGKPISKIFAAEDNKYHQSITVTITHEIAEMLADPYICDCIQVSNTQLYAKEIADPVEADVLGYMVDGVLCSDFVTPAWFIPGHPGPIFDYAKRCARPMQILPGGYMSVFVSGRGWTQIDDKHAEVSIDLKGENSRPAKYGRDRSGEEVT